MLLKIKPALLLLLKLLIGVALGTVLMISVYFIPTNQIEKHVGDSAEVFETEGRYPEFFVNKGIGGRGYCNSRRDNVSDSFMLLEAAYNSKYETTKKYQNKGPVALSMLNIRYGKPSDPVGSLVDHYKYGKKFNYEIMYGRYWNGYLSYLKPLLLLFDYSAIRIINIVFQIILFALIIFFLNKKGLKQYIAPYILSILMAMPVAIVLNMQLSNCFTVLNMGMLVVLLCKDYLEERVCSIFLILGMVTAFIDLFSYPLATFGVPAVLYFTITKSESIKKVFIKIVKIGLPWGIGYGVMWLGKWIIGNILSGENIFKDGFEQVVLRTGTAAEKGSELHFSIFRAVGRNLGAFLFTPVTIILGIFVLVMLILIIRKLKGHLKEKSQKIELLKISIPYLLLMFAPIVWYIVIRNHSATHAYLFANKELLISSMALAFWMMKLYIWSKSLNQESVNIEKAG